MPKVVHWIMVLGGLRPLHSMRRGDATSSGGRNGVRGEQVDGWITGMSRLYPEIEPFAQGMLDVGDGHRVYWESCGNPLGKPALVLHGGPGSGAGAFWRRFF